MFLNHRIHENIPVLLCNLLKAKRAGQFQTCQGHILLLMSGSRGERRLRELGRLVRNLLEQSLTRLECKCDAACAGKQLTTSESAPTTRKQARERMHTSKEMLRKGGSKVRLQQLLKDQV